MSKIFDSHSHYNDDAFKNDLEAVITNIINNDVEYVINCGASLNSSELAVKQSSDYDFMYCSVGIHPQYAASATHDALHQLQELANYNKVVAIGEAGLDYYYPERASDEEQKYAFIKQIELANKLDKPLIIHTRDAMKDTLDILNKYPVNSGVIHCYSGSAESCKLLVDMGFYIGFTGVVTFKNARKAIESLKVVPLDRLLIETDCPYMAPEPNRGKRCDSSMLHFTAEKIASELNLSKEELIKITNDNAKRLFKIK